MKKLYDFIKELLESKRDSRVNDIVTWWEILDLLEEAERMYEAYLEDESKKVNELYKERNG